ncbi:MAG: hypothetical protein H6710_12585 [Myxococcales bacterium]|nr:hypothetical protein [Myxococcales bacterium]MCB9705249.1 hypothetical protein [Myxococcales bacterium]
MFEAKLPDDIGAAMLRALKALALADGDFDPRERRFLEVNHRLLGAAGEADEIVPATPAEVAAIVVAPEQRRDLMQRLVVMSALDEVIHPDELRLLRAFAAAMEVDEPAIDAMQRLAEGRLRMAAVDVGRRTRPPRAPGEGIGGLWKRAKNLLGVADARMAERYHNLANYPRESLGRRFYEHCMGNGYRLPGEKGGTPEAMVFHDLGHVLAGYETDPAGEVEMGGFEAGYMGDDGFSVTLLVLLLFHLGAEVSPGASSARGAFDPERYLKAFRRGQAMKVDLRRWDPWPFMDQELDKVRGYLEIPAA